MRRFGGAMIVGANIMQDLQKTIIRLLLIVVCLMNYSLAFGETITITKQASLNMGFDTSYYSDIIIGNMPANAKITSVKAVFAYSKCPMDFVTVTLSKLKNDAAAKVIFTDNYSNYILRNNISYPFIDSSYYNNSAINDTWRLNINIATQNCASCYVNYVGGNGHSAYFYNWTLTITYDLVQTTITTPGKRYFTGSTSNTNANFQWSSLPNASGYKLNIYDAITDSLVQGGTPATTSFTSTSLTPLKRYSWEVAGSNSLGTGSFTERRKFLIAPNAECWPEIGQPAPVQGHLDTCYDLSSSTDSYLLKDISRRGNMNVDGHNGNMPDSSSIITQQYVTGPQYPMSDPDNNWVDPSQKPGIDAHVNAGRVYDYLLSPLQLSSPDGRGSSMISIVESMGGSCPDGVAYFDINSPVPTTNYCAGFSSSSVLSVVAHEWAHVITHRASNRGNNVGLGFVGEGRAVTEAFSDWMGIAIKQDFSKNYDDWVIPVITDSTGNIIEKRDLSNPANSVPAQPKYYGRGAWSDDPYSIMGVPNQMFYFLAKGINGVVGGVGIDKAIKIAFMANMEFWNIDPSPPATFLKARKGMIDAAAKLYPSTPSVADQVGKAWDAVGVTATSTPQVMKTIRTLPTILGIILDTN